MLEPEGRVFYGLLRARPAQEVAGQVEVSLSLRTLNLLWHGNAATAPALDSAYDALRDLRYVMHLAMCVIPAHFVV